MFPIYILKDLTGSIPKDNICYLIAKNGIFVKKKLGLIESLTSVDEIPFLKRSVVPYATMSIPKIPKLQFAQVLGFFKKVYELYHSESEVFLYYSASKEEFEIKIPYQKVSYASCKSVRGKTPKGYQIVSSIHSHANFGAFHSGIDVDDEKYFEGLHITVGNVDDDEFTVVSSIVSNKTRFGIDPLDCIEGLIQTTTELKVKRELYAIPGTEQVHFDPHWMSFVEKMHPIKTQYRGYQGYQPTLFPYQRFVSDQNKMYKSAEKEIGKHKANDPCLECPFNKEDKNGSEIENLELFLQGDTIEETTTVKDLFPDEALSLEEDLFLNWGI